MKMAEKKQREKTHYHFNRKPVRRLYADRYLLITLLSFAASITITRLFLFLTGYPQIGSGSLHIAHVLWGGLILFVAALIPLVFSNRWMFDLSSLLAGVGVGLFIDEVGKFITSQNDYFYPWAAPIIYALFLLTLLLYNQVRKTRQIDVRTNFYHVLEEMQEILDRDLNKAEKEEISGQLELISAESHQIETTLLARKLIEYLDLPSIKAESKFESPFDRIIHIWLNFEATTFNRDRHRFLLTISLFVWACWAVIHPILSWYTSIHQIPIPGIFSELINTQLKLSIAKIGLAEIHLGLEILAGLVLLIACALMWLRKEHLAVQMIIFDLLFSLSVVYLLVFYYDQFSSIVYAAIQFCLLATSLRYRTRFLLGNK